KRIFRSNWAGVAAPAATAVPPTPAVTAAKLPAASTAARRRASRVVPHRLGPVNELPAHPANVHKAARTNTLLYGCRNPALFGPYIRVTFNGAFRVTSYCKTLISA